MKKLILVFLLFTSILANAQSKLHFFLGPGLAYYQGDVSESGLPHPGMLKFNFKAGLGYDFHKHWGVRLHYSQGSIAGSDAFTDDIGKQARGISFNTGIIDAGLTLKFNNFLNREKFMNYLFFGADYLNMNVARTVSGTIPLAPEVAFSNHQVNFPLGLGIGYWLTCNFGLAIEGAIHFTPTDYLDGTKYSANPTAPDSYIDTHLLLVYRMCKNRGKKKEYMGECPSF